MTFYNDIHQCDKYEHQNQQQKQTENQNQPQTLIHANNANTNKYQHSIPTVGITPTFPAFILLGLVSIHWILVLYTMIALDLS